MAGKQIRWHRQVVLQDLLARRWQALSGATVTDIFGFSVWRLRQAPEASYRDRERVGLRFTETRSGHSEP